MPDPIFLSGEEVPSYFKGVELMTAGMQWPGMNGPCTVTMEHLADAVRAFNDPHIQPPRIKLGHTSAVNGDHPNYDPFADVGDAEPSFGTFTNLRLENDGAVLVGDADNVPTWLAEAALSAYPNRSAEGDWNVVSGGMDVQTNGGQRYSFVCTAVSLLGVYLPAISDLEDLQTLIVSGPAALTETQEPAALTAADGAALSVSYDTIWERSIAWLREHKPDWPYSWTRDVRVDPDECIIDDDDGHLWALPFTTNGGDTITFGPDVAPRAPVQYPPAAAPASMAASRVVASFARPADLPARPAAVAASNPAATGRPDPEGGAMDESVREILVGLGLNPDEATEQQMQIATNAAAYAIATAPKPEAPAGDAAPAVVETAAADDVRVDTDRVPVAAATAAAWKSGTAYKAGDQVTYSGKTYKAKDAHTSSTTFDITHWTLVVAASRQIPEGAVVIDAEELARLRAGAEAGTRLATEKATDERDRVLMSARDEGRFPPARLAHYTKLYDADPEGTTVLLTAAEDKGGLAKGTVPLTARAEAPDPLGADADGMTAADRALLTASRSRAGYSTQEA